MKGIFFKKSTPMPSLHASLSNPTPLRKKCAILRVIISGKPLQKNLLFFPYMFVIQTTLSHLFAASPSAAAAAKSFKTCAASCKMMKLAWIEDCKCEDEDIVGGENTSVGTWMRLRLGLDFFVGFSCPSLCLYKNGGIQIVVLFLKRSRFYPDAGGTDSRRDTEKDCFNFKKKLSLTIRNSALCTVCSGTTLLYWDKTVAVRQVCPSQVKISM